MLQFWKKSGHNDTKSPNSPKSPEPPHHQANNPAKQSPPLAQFIDEGLFDVDDFAVSKERSKLARTLHAALSDKSALTHLLAFMESRNASPYILSYLEIDAFKADISQLKADHDSLSVSTDCDSFTADLRSLNDYSDRLTPPGSCDASPKHEKKLVDVALAIFKRYIAQEAASNINCPDDIRNEIVENVCNLDKQLNVSCFDKAQAFAFKTMEADYFEAFLASDFFCKHQIDVLTSGFVVLDDILYNETALFYFMDFLEQEGGRGLLEFWIAATNLQQQLQAQKEFFDPIEAQNDAVVLYDKYFSLQATNPLGFGDRVRFLVEQSICGENGLVLECFQLPIGIVEQALDKQYLKAFLASQLYYKYLSELINTVQANGYAMGVENSRKSPSDCSSERSFSTNSTFLALEINQAPNRNRYNKDMSIDTRLLCDPDALWKRRRSARLSCGRVTSLGKFVTDLEPEPDRNGFKLRNVVRRIVSLDEDSKKEEMAWQVAEMIVKDITNITLNTEEKAPDL